MIGHEKVFRAAFLQGEGIKRPKLFACFLLQDIAVSFILFKAVSISELPLFKPLFKQQGFPDPVITVSHIRHISLISYLNHQYLVCSGHVVNTVYGTPGKQVSYCKAQFFQGNGEEPVHFKTIAAPLVDNQFIK